MDYSGKNNSYRGEKDTLALNIAYVPPTIMRLTKVPNNKTFEIMGFFSVLRANVDFSSILHVADEPEQLEFNNIVRERGLKAALEWREGLYNI